MELPDSFRKTPDAIEEEQRIRDTCSMVAAAIVDHHAELGVSELRVPIGFPPNRTIDNDTFAQDVAEGALNALKRRNSKLASKFVYDEDKSGLIEDVKKRHKTTGWRPNVMMPGIALVLRPNQEASL